LRKIIDQFGIDTTWSYDFQYLDIEIYKILSDEMLKMLSFALLTVTCVVLFITFNLSITIFVVTVVSLVVLYMTAACHFWGLDLNVIFAVNMAFALGIAVDYSVHIAHKYLIIVPPASM